MQVESLRQLSDAAGNQIGATQASLEQLQADKEQQEQQLKAQLQATQVRRMVGEQHVAHLAALDACGRYMLLNARAYCVCRVHVYLLLTVLP